MDPSDEDCKHDDDDNQYNFDENDAESEIQFSQVPQFTAGWVGEPD